MSSCGYSDPSFATAASHLYRRGDVADHPET